MEEAANKEMLSMQEDLVNQLGIQQSQIGDMTEYTSELWERIHAHMRGSDFEVGEDDQEHTDREILLKCKHQNDLEELGGNIEEAKLAAVQLEESRKEIRDLQDKLADSDAEKERQAKQLEKLRADMGHLEEEIARLKTEARNSTRDKEQADEQVDNLKREYKRVQAELKDKSSRLESDQSSEDLSKLKQENEVLKVEAARAQAAEAATKKELADRDELASRKSEQLKKSSAELDSNAEKLAVLERASKAKDAELAAAHDEAAKLKAKHADAVEELEEVRSQTQSIRRQTIGAADELAEEREATVQLRQKLKAATQDAEDERESARAIKRERDRLKSDVEEQESTVRKLRTEVNEISSRQTSFYAQSPFMVSPQKDAGGGLDASLLDSSRLEMIHVAKKQIAMAESMLDESVVALEAKDTELNSLRAQLRQAQIKIEELERKLADAEQDRGELNLLRGQNAALQSELEATAAAAANNGGLLASSPQRQEQRRQQRDAIGDDDAGSIAPAGGVQGEGNLAVGADGTVTPGAAAAAGRTQREYEILLEDWEDQTWFAPVSDDPSSRSFPVNVGPTNAALELQVIGPKWLVVGKQGVQLVERDGQHNCVADWRLSDVKRYAEDTDMITVDVSTRANAFAGGWAFDTSRGQAAAVFNHVNRLMKPIRRRARNNARAAPAPQQYALGGLAGSTYAPGGWPYSQQFVGGGPVGQQPPMQQSNGTDAYYF